MSHRLPDAHTMLRDRLGFVQRGYVRWNLRLIARLSQQNMPGG